LLVGDGNCVEVRFLTVASCKVGILGNPRTTSVNYNNVVVIDSIVGIALRSTAKSIDNTALIRNSYIGILQRNNCLSCYSQTNGYHTCADMYAVSMFVPT
jgi:hypothetical protein